MPTTKQFENLDKRVHNQVTKLGSMVGNVLKLLKEKDSIIEQNPNRIDKLEEVINNLGSSFASIKTIEKTPSNNHNFIYAP